jgi:hypothetical protein
MLSHDLAELYQVETKVLNQQVKRNIRRFPERYMFQLSQNEYNALRSYFVTLKPFPMNLTDKLTISEEVILTKIFLIRGQKVMIDRDLAELYGVETWTLNQAVKRNLKRFPEDFMFQLTVAEFENWKSQIVISNLEVAICVLQ